MVYTRPDNDHISLVLNVFVVLELIFLPGIFFSGNPCSDLITA
jgi:hypothetical protein